MVLSSSTLQTLYVDDPHLGVHKRTLAFHYEGDCGPQYNKSNVALMKTIAQLVFQFYQLQCHGLGDGEL